MLKETTHATVPEGDDVFATAAADRHDARPRAAPVPAGGRLKAAVATLGCKVNQYEAAAMTECLAAAGYHLVDPHAVADIYIINTCTVTQGADHESRQLIRRARKLNPRAAIIVTGCYAQTAPHVFSGMPGVAVVAGTREKNRMGEIIAALRDRHPQGMEAPPAVYVASVNGYEEADFPPISRFPDHTRAFLKIQDGCNAFCSYCIVPYARGRSRSIGAAEAIARIESLARHGYREVVLTGIHLGVYGEDRRDGSTLAKILRHVEDYRLVERLRLSSLEPREIDDDILAIMSAARIVCPHLHIPLQSGDDGILARMGRNYDRAFFQELLQKAASLRPDMTIGMDTMAGFPGEDEKAFANTLDMVAAAPIAYLHVFPYSRRPGTAAARMDSHVPEEEKKRRCRILRELGGRKRRRHLERFVGAVLPVLVEGRENRRGGAFRGLSHNYLSVIFKHGSAVTTNAIIPTKITALANDRALLGTPAHER
ncbi:MAG: tRNA (N(6)-L-threonylcarbamoyladenosine(37)-C(2))-methylthiotransferase MtaB [Pseudomonadota bacterium]|nr:tRNA (N(6)-L-threonylcarbamoyladenosine(37)-C(2))-methylthiotransferase MtaB [Pseudomonadota bacterium]